MNLAPPRFPTTMPRHDEPITIDRSEMTSAASIPSPPRRPARRARSPNRRRASLRRRVPRRNARLARVRRRRLGPPRGARPLARRAVIHLVPQLRIQICVRPQDLRRGIDGLASICRSELPPDGHAPSGRRRQGPRAVSRVRRRGALAAHRDARGARDGVLLVRVRAVWRGDAPHGRHGRRHGQGVGAADVASPDLPAWATY